MKVCMIPSVQQMGAEESGIKRVVEAYTRYLGGMGVEFVSEHDSYDVKSVHAGTVVDADVAHCHGLYWTADYPAALWEWKANAMVAMAMRNAKVITVPSPWVAETFQRNMRMTPEVVGHGVEWGDWQHDEESMGYVLWNKNRIGDVCDAEPVGVLATKNPSIRFVSTFMPRTQLQNVESTGVISHDKMKKLVQRAGVYMATTKETFGIGALEAMACFPSETNVEAVGVIRSMERLYNGPLLTIVTGHAAIRVTPEHPFFTNLGWVLAKDLHLDHLLCYNGSYRTYRGIDANGCAEKVYSGTIGSVFRTIQDNADERCGGNVGNKGEDAWGNISSFRNKKAAVNVYTSASRKSDIGRIGIHSGDYRRGGHRNDSHSNEKVQGNNIQKMGSAVADIEYVFRTDGMVKGKVESRRCIPSAINIQRTTRKGKELLSIREGIDATCPIQGFDSLLGNKERTHETCCRVGGIKAERVQGGGIHGQAGRNNYDDSSSQYQAIKEITSEFVTELPVYNLTTLSGTYLAEGYVVHNCGKPVLGYAHGGIADLVQHGVNGYLARPGDLEDLNQGLNYCLENSVMLGNNGRELAKRYSWGSAAQKVYAIYDGIMHPEPPTVSIIVPSYNYGDKVERAIISALGQTMYLKDVIVVDDGSNDGGLTKDVVTKLAERDNRVRFYRKDNGGVATARNYGIAHSDSKYICCLDADDAIEPNFLEVLVAELEKEHNLGIAYSGLRYILPDGKTGISDWPEAWDFQAQLKRKNQIPTCCVFRKIMWERLGGYKQRYAPDGQGAEDAEFWLRSGAYGWRAKKVTEDALFIYSWMSGRASGAKNYKEVDWLELHPWTRDNKHPFASYALPDKWSHPVTQYDEPEVSVVIPVGPGHEALLIDALDSLESQVFRKWEAIVVWDAPGEPIYEGMDYRIAYPYVRWIITGGSIGAGATRNRGAKMARGRLLLFLDADDFLLPNFLERTVQVFNSTGYATYTDYEGWAIVNDVSQLAKDLRDNVKGVEHGVTRIGYRSSDYDCERALRQPESENPYIWCDINTLHPKLWYNEIGGFDESMSSWEDVDYWWRMARAGHCFQRIEQELFVYRFHTGKRRERGLGSWPQLLDGLMQKFIKEKSMGCSSCGKNKVTSPQYTPQTQQEISAFSDNDLVLIVYMHPNIGQHSVVGNSTKKFYGYRGRGEEFLVHRADIAARPKVFVPIEVAPVIDEPPPVIPPPPKAIEEAITRATENNLERIKAKNKDSDIVISTREPKAVDMAPMNKMWENIAEAQADMEKAETSVVKRPRKVRNAVNS
jgi:glycosyltransferase involved in cell wall biosynthesis